MEIPDNVALEDVAAKSSAKARVKLSKWDYLYLLITAATLLISCVVVSAKKYYWNDELFSYFMTSEPTFSRMVAAFNDKLNNTPILYFLLGWSWDKVFGSSELSLRLFTWLGMCAALVLTWKMLRRSYALWPTAIGTVLVFCTSHIILEQNTEARMYGLFLAIAALALLLYDGFYRRSSISTSSLVVNACVHAAFVHTHLFGGFYSAAILFSLVVVDRIYKLFRPRLYLSILLGWATLIFYIPAFLIQADAGKPRTWIPAPDFRDLLDIYDFSRSAPSFASRILLVGVLLIVCYSFISGRDKSRYLNRYKPNKSEIPVLMAGFLFIITPFFIWLISLTIKPIFYPRYMIPTALGWVVAITFVVSRSFQPLTSSDGKTGGLNFDFVFAKPVISLLALLLIAIALYSPLRFAREYKREGKPGLWDIKSEAMHKYSQLPRVVTSGGLLLQRAYYSSERSKYFYILDWKSAVDKNSGTFPPQEYKHMQAWKRNFPQLFKDNILSSEEFLRRYDRFLVLDRPNYLQKCPQNHVGLHTPDLWDNCLSCPQWVEMRLLNNRKYKVTVIDNYEWFALLLVEKQDVGLASNTKKELNIAAP